MPTPFQFYPLAGCEKKAADFQTLMANSVVRLFKEGFTPVAGTPRADYLTNEADYSGYLAGGIVVPAFADPILSPGAGYQIGSPIVQFAFNSGLGAVTNLIAGGWIETAGGVIMLVWGYPDFIPMTADGNGIPVNVIFPFPVGS